VISEYREDVEEETSMPRMRFISRSARRKRSTRDHRGAAAVEFALVSTILFPVLFGIVDYGLWFNDSLNTRQGVREGARLAAVENFATPAASPCAALTGTDKLACITKEQISPAAGVAYVKVLVPSGGWVRGNSVVVCGMTKVTGVTGITPLPQDGLVRSKTRMSIEVVTVPLTASATTGTPAGANWDWCG
jgi:Flp pilus assembly protein TadG